MSEPQNEFERQLRQYGEELDAEAKSLPQTRRTNVNLVLAEVRKKLGARELTAAPWWRRIFPAGGRFKLSFGLVLAGAAAVVLFLGLQFLLTPKTHPVTFEFAALSDRGTPANPPQTSAQLAGRFILELDLAAMQIRFREGPVVYSGKLTTAAKEEADIFPYDFTAESRDKSGEPVVLTGRVKVTTKKPGAPPRTPEEVARIHVGGTVTLGNRQTNVLDRLWP